MHVSEMEVSTTEWADMVTRAWFTDGSDPADDRDIAEALDEIFYS